MSICLCIIDDGIHTVADILCWCTNRGSNGNCKEMLQGYLTGQQPSRGIEAGIQKCNW